MPYLVHSMRGFAGIATANFFGRYHHYLIGFVIATFLAKFYDEFSIGFAIAFTSVIVASSLAISPHIFMRFGTKRALVLLGLAGIMSALGLSMSESGIIAIAFFTMQGIVAYNILLGLDILLEAITTNKDTGRLRGTYLVISNTTVIVALLSLSYILYDNNYSDVFFIAAAFLIPFTLVAALFLPSVSYVVTSYSKSFFGIIKLILSRPPLMVIFGLHFLLLLYFTWSVFYIPLYLVGHVGFTWKVAGMLMALSILPYIIFEYPLGKIADKYLGEKEITIVGFVIAGLLTALISFLSDANLILWAVVIFVGNIGGAAIEIMTETHFFKLVSARDENIIGIFRMLRPISAVIGPITASLSLLLVPFSMLFVVFGAIILLGAPLALLMKDSR